NVVDDVIVGVVELERIAAYPSVVRPQGQVEDLVGQHEYQLVLSELTNELGIHGETSGREDADGRNPAVQRDPHGPRQSREMGKGHGDHAQGMFQAALRFQGVRCVVRGSGGHSFVTLLSRLNMVSSAPRAPQRSTRSARSVS